MPNTASVATPPPWTVERIPAFAHKDPDLHIAEGDLFWIVAGTGNGDVLATIHQTHARNAEANAAVIGAAHDLLKALKALVVRAKRELADPEDVAELAQADAAVRKADVIAARLA